MILVLGASGTNGREVVQRLAREGVPVRALLRDPGKAAAHGLNVPGVEIAAGDFDDAGSLATAFAGVEQAFVLTAVSPRHVEWVGRAIDAAREAGTRHLVKFSAMGAATDSAAELLRQHGESDRMVKNSGLAYTILAPNSFYQNTLWSAGSIKGEGVIYAPLGDSRQSFVDVRDIADVAVQALTRPGHEGQVDEITGPESLSQADLAATLGSVLGKPVRYVAIPPEAAADAMLKSGMPEWNVRVLIELYKEFTTGAAARTTDTVARILNRSPIRFADFAREHAAAFS